MAGSLKDGCMWFGLAAGTASGLIYAYVRSYSTGQPRTPPPNQHPIGKLVGFMPHDSRTESPMQAQP